MMQNSEITLAEVDIEFSEEGLSSPAQVLLSLSPVPDIRFEVLHDSPAIHSLLANYLLQNESTAGLCTNNIFNSDFPCKFRQNVRWACPAKTVPSSLHR